MAPDHGSFGLGALICALMLICPAASIRPISDAHRSAALELFVPVDGLFPSLEETYHALRTFLILGVGETSEINRATCPVVLEKLKSPSSSPKGFYDALRVNSILGCQIGSETLEDVASQLRDLIKGADSLMDFYYSVIGLLHVKGQGVSAVLSDAQGVFHSIKALSQSDGRWRFDSNNAESSTHAAGIALEALAGVVSLADGEVDQSKIGIVKHDIVKLFDSIKSYDDGTLYFHEKHIDGSEYEGPLATTASVVRGVASFAAVVSGKLNIPGDKIFGIAKFLLTIGVPGISKDFFNQIDSLSYIENNRISIPLILSLPSTVLSLTTKDQLKVEVTTVFGSAAPPLTVNLVQTSTSEVKNTPTVENQELQFDQENNIHYLDIVPLKIDIGKYTLKFEISLHDPENLNIYATGGRMQYLVFLTGYVKVDNPQIGVLDTDGESSASLVKLDFSKLDKVSLVANHLQKMRLSFQLVTPLGHTFKPHQVYIKLRHEGRVEHIFQLESSARQYKIQLDFLALLEQIYYLSGRYEIELAIGDAAMENSFLHILGHIDLTLPDPPEKVSRPPPQSVDRYSRFGPKQEILHIFRTPEKRPPKELSFTFLGFTLLPLGGFLIGLLTLGVNLKGFPSSSLPALSSILFHAGIAATLLLYGLFWLKFDLFTTLKLLGLLGVFLVFTGHRTLSYLASTSTKTKTN
ncbi:dolichyl-diphosphooligosaccharide--protein glycosyltransferase subunit 2-like isoform X1 [Zingiber officinale]|uniref:dolichyl-diphosphooligosaccharide--protein glycosyltransferase subunit 2-like isoform X1 n=1 Tax=Zingiber officinale TaxID=94328 RepID=UPI001C4D0663|nr:dolichyl-diphosphooligosaccharide--protein glycosyltransferase subunit 2-like isoform X1 [Zingiber officinale]